MNIKPKVSRPRVLDLISTNRKLQRVQTHSVFLIDGWSMSGVCNHFPSGDFPSLKTLSRSYRAKRHFLSSGVAANQYIPFLS